jgi:hypothetical protein
MTTFGWVLLLVGVVCIPFGVGVQVKWPRRRVGDSEFSAFGITFKSPSLGVIVIGAGLVLVAAAVGTGRAGASTPSGSGSGGVVVGTPQPNGSFAAFPVHLAARGLKGRVCIARWTLFDAANGTEHAIRQPGFSDQVAARFVPRSDDDSKDVTVDVPAPGDETTLVVLRVVLDNDLGDQIGSDDSPPLHLTSPP